MDEEAPVRKKNRNQSAKRKKVKLIGCDEGCDCCPLPTRAESQEQVAVLPDEAKHAETPTVVECGVQCIMNEVKDSGTQTEVHLPNTMRDVVWMPSGLDPVIDCEYVDEDSLGDESIGPGIVQGPTVSDIDAIDVSSINDDGSEGTATTTPTTTGTGYMDDDHEPVEPPKLGDTGILPEWPGDVGFAKFGECSPVAKLLQNF